MASNKTMENSTTPADLFKFNPESSVAHLIKAGVLSTFLHYTKKSTTPIEKIRRDISDSLLALTAAELPPKRQDRKAPRFKGKREFKFFSAQGGGLTEICVDENAEMTVIGDFPFFGSKVTPKTADERRNDQFKDDFEGWIMESLNFFNDPVIESIIKGVYSILVLSEDVAGPFVEQFEKHIELLKQLAKLYASAKLEDLDREKGCYSHGLAVKDGLKALGEQ